MDRDDLVELHSIQPIANVRSILARGILSHNAATAVDHIDISASEIQDLRAEVVVPGGRRLHDYANLYFDARNPMMSRRRSKHDELCVLRVSCEVLDLPGVVVTDGNASSDYIRFGAAVDGLAFIDHELTFAEWWTDDDTDEYRRKKRARCAEVLVPNRVPPDFVIGAYVCGHGSDGPTGLPSTLDVREERRLFFC